MSLRTNIHALCFSHLTDTPLGLASAPPLIRQLEAAIKPDKGGGKSSGNGKGDLINMTALKLWEEIAADIGIHTMEAGLPTHQDRILMLKGWTAMEDDAEYGDFMEHLTLDWCDMITALLSPLKPYHPAHPCPSCGLRFHGEDNAPPLNVHYLGPDGHPMHPHDWRMECANCGSEWSGDTLGAVAKAMSA